jgi:hypothetical protein
MATARSASRAKVAGEISEAETQACRPPISTRSPISTASERSACSSLPSRRLMEIEEPSTTSTSAAPAPALTASSSRRWLRVSSEAVMVISGLVWRMVHDLIKHMAKAVGRGKAWGKT